MKTKRSRAARSESAPDQAVARVIAELQDILAWWTREQHRVPSGTPLAGRIEELIRRLQDEYPDL